MRHIFIIGSRGLPAQYGGFETFVEELISHQKSSDLLYHVACLSEEDSGRHFSYKGADCFTINPPKIGSARVIAYDIMAIRYCLKWIAKKQIERPIFYILGNTIGAFMAPLKKAIQQCGGVLYVNPDGLEWRRSKWTKPVQMYLKTAEKAMTRLADLIVADNQGIETYLKSRYPWVITRFIAYGTSLQASSLTKSHQKVRAFFEKWQSREDDYYLIVGRFVPENNYEIMLKAYMATKTSKKLLIVCNYQDNPYFEQLKQSTQCDQDARIQFVGTVYDKELLTYLRQHAYAYIHGHEVGGTNPSLLEALAHTATNLVLDVDFNRHVAADTALYWQKDKTSLTTLIDQVDSKGEDSLGMAAKERMRRYYSWEKIINDYEALFLYEG